MAKHGIDQTVGVKAVFTTIEQRLVIKRLGAVLGGDTALLRTVLAAVIG